MIRQARNFFIRRKLNRLVSDFVRQEIRKAQELRAKNEARVLAMPGKPNVARVIEHIKTLKAVS